MRIAWFTPDDPNCETISGYFSSVLLPLLKEFDIQVFTNTFDQHEHFLQAAKLHQEKPFDLFVYQLENDPRLNFARIHCGLVPGLSIFHHYNFLNFGPEPILNSPWKEVIEKFVSNGDAWPERGKKFFQEGPLAHRESAFCLQPVFTNPLNVSDFNNQINLSIAKHKDIKPVYLPFPVAENSINSTKRNAIAFAGSPSIPNRSHKLLEALSSVKDYELLWLVDHTEEEKAEELLEEFSVEDFRLVLGRNPANWKTILDEAKLAFHLQFSVFEQLCPYLQISMRAGVPVALSDFAYSDSIVDDLVFKIPAGEQEVPVIKALLESLNEHDLSSLEKNTRQYAIENFSAESVAAQLSSLIKNNAKKYSEFYSEWREFHSAAKESVINEIKDDQNFLSWQEMHGKDFKELGWL